MADPTLRACPFCGGAAYQREWQAESLWSHAIVPWCEVGCRDCDIAMRSCESDDAVKQWNTRRQPQKKGGAMGTGDRTVALVDDVLALLPHLTGDELRRVAEAMPRVAGGWETRDGYTQRCYLERREGGPDLAACISEGGTGLVASTWIDDAYQTGLHPTARAAQAACDARLEAAGVRLCGERTREEGT